MPLFRYRATSREGKIAIGTIEADSETALNALLAVREFELISTRTISLPHQRASLLSLKTPEAEVIIFFCAAFSRLLSSGVAPPDALSLLAESDRLGLFSGIVRQMRQDLDHGKSLSDSFASQSVAFDPVFLALLKAGEVSGNLAETFNHLSHYQKQRMLWRKQLNKALRYPLFLLAIAGGTAVFMLALVVPQVVEYLTSLQNDLPPATKALIALSNFVAIAWKFILLLFLLSGLSIFALRKFSSSVATSFDGAIIKMPFMGSILKNLSVARFTQSLSRLMIAGFSLPEATDLCLPTLHNKALQKLAFQAKERVLNGEPASTAFRGFILPLSLQMLHVGEQSGHLPASFTQISDDAQSKAQEDIERFLGSLEPLLTLMVGALLAWVVLAVLGPLYTGLGKTGVLS